MPEIVAFIGDIALTYALPAILVLMLVVFIHELGHFLVGRWCGVGIQEFSIGFGKELIGFNDKYGTRWKLSAIPLGGYVKFVGDENAASLPKASQEPGAQRHDRVEPSSVPNTEYDRQLQYEKHRHGDTEGLLDVHAGRQPDEEIEPGSKETGPQNPRGEAVENFHVQNSERAEHHTNKGADTAFGSVVDKEGLRYVAPLIVDQQRKPGTDIEGGDKNAQNQDKGRPTALVPASGKALVAGSLAAQYDKTHFHNASVWKRTAIVTAGPIANFLLAIAIFAVVFATLGRPITAPRVDTLLPGGAAEAAGFLPGDLIVEIDGKPIDSFSQIQQIVTLSAGNTLTIVVDRDGERVTLTPTPERREMPDGLGGIQRVGVLGITRNMAEGDLVFKRYTPLQAIVEGVKETGHIIERTMTYIGRLIAGRETADQLSGPIRIAQVSGVIASSGGIPALLHLSAILSVSIGLINLFPIPMLDGGHLVFYAIEAIRGRPVSQRAQEIGFRIGLALVIMLFVFVTFNDIVRLAGI